MLRGLYGAGLVVDVPLYAAGTNAFKTSPTLAAGDVKVRNDRLVAANPTSKAIAFTSGGTYEIRPGDTITGATSAATAIVIGVRITGGSYAGGDAAGILFVEQDSGTFQSENINVGATTNVLTIGAALGTAGTPVYIANGITAIGIPSAQMQGSRGTVVFVDAAGAEWDDQAQDFETYGHPLAHDPQGCIASGAGHASGQTTTAIVFAVAPQALPVRGFFFMCTKLGSVPRCGIVKSFSTLTITPYEVLVGGAIDATWNIAVFAAASGIPAWLTGMEDVDFAATMKTSIQTAAAAAITAATLATAANLGTAQTSLTAIQALLANPAGFKKNTLVEDFSFPMRDTTGALVTGLTVTLQIQKDGGSFNNVAGTVAEIGTTGVYQVTTSPALTATEMNANQVVLKGTAVGAIATLIEIYTEP